LSKSIAFSFADNISQSIFRLIETYGEDEIYNIYFDE